MTMGHAIAKRFKFGEYKQKLSKGLKEAWLLSKVRTSEKEQHKQNSYVTEKSQETIEDYGHEDSFIDDIEKDLDLMLKDGMVGV